jgi:hypothetical protein
MVNKRNVIVVLFCLHATASAYSGNPEKSYLRRAVTMLALTQSALFASAFDAQLCALFMSPVYITTATHESHPRLIGITKRVGWQGCMGVYEQQPETPSTRKMFEACIQKEQEKLQVDYTRVCSPNAAWPNVTIPSAGFGLNYRVFSTDICTGSSLYSPWDCPPHETIPAADFGRFKRESQWLMRKN